MEDRERIADRLSKMPQIYNDPVLYRVYQLVMMPENDPVEVLIGAIGIYSDNYKRLMDTVVDLAFKRPPVPIVLHDADGVPWGFSPIAQKEK